jgi:hypothetical protein
MQRTPESAAAPAEDNAPCKRPASKRSSCFRRFVRRPHRERKARRFPHVLRTLCLGFWSDRRRRVGAGHREWLRCGSASFRSSCSAQ